MCLMSMNLQVGQPDTHGTNPLRLDVPTKLIKLFDLSGEAEKLLLCTVCSSYLMPKSLQYLGSAESFDGHASDKAMGTVVFLKEFRATRLWDWMEMNVRPTDPC